MDQKKIGKIFKALHESIPDPKSELNYNSPFELLIAVILSAHTTDKSVNAATVNLFKVANTPADILRLGERQLISYIKNVGLYNTKAANIIKTCKILAEQYHSQLPHTREELESLPGVGRKTAGIILNTIFNQPIIAVDTHVFRVANRTKLAIGKTPRDVENALGKVIPPQYLPFAHHLLLLHGRYVCKGRKPLCKECVICRWCEYEAKNVKI